MSTHCSNILLLTACKVNYYIQSQKCDYSKQGNVKFYYTTCTLYSETPIICAAAVLGSLGLDFRLKNHGKLMSVNIIIEAQIIITGSDVQSMACWLAQ